MSAYADSSDMTDRFDDRTLKDLVSDSGVPVVNLAADSKMSAALDDATGAINAALQIGDQYKPADLSALTGESLAYLKRITCEIAMSYLLRRRPEKYGKASIEVQESINALLEQFRKGLRVFDIDANRAAGVPTIDGPTAADYNRLNMIPDRTRHYFPSRKSRIPIGR